MYLILHGLEANKYSYQVKMQLKIKIKNCRFFWRCQELL